MKELKIVRADLEKALGLRIPDSAVVEVTITAKGEKLEKGGNPTITGRITFEAGKPIDVRAINTSVFNRDWFKHGPVGPCW